jgi:tetratricopeptide (TPR) repeat protein
LALNPGTRLGPYEILAPLGAGGMGEVYTARDTRLDRRVAIKVLPAQVADDPQFRDRFAREAKAIAALTHPHICTLYDVGITPDGPAFLIMELLQGETVQQRLARGPLNVALVVDLGIALADALDAAHRVGIVHRDIKPANIFLTAHGPKILDFGLAKAAPRSVATLSMQSTMAPIPQLTEAGSMVGTVAYMSPEQLRGEALDERTDLFSLGLVLYEMATGRAAFAGATSAVISAAILHSAPLTPRAVRPDVPAGLEDVILKAIEKDRHLRGQHASDIRADLQRLKRDTSAGRAPTSATRGAITGIARRWTVAVPAVAAVLALSAAGYLYAHRAPALTDKDTIVLADFTNTTGDAVFDGTLRQGLVIQLEQSPYLSLVSDERIQGTLGLMGQPGDARLTPKLAEEICERTASAAVLEGSIASLGSQYVVGLRAKNCRNGNVLDEEQVQAARKEDVLNVLSRIASKFRTRVGESLATVHKHDTPLEEATTPSLEALKAYSTGWRVASSTGNKAAVPFFERAVEIDPKFALAYARLGHAQATGTGESGLAAENVGKAYRLRDRASDSEKFFIASTYDMDVTGNLERAQQTFELWAETYPREIPPHGFLSGWVYPVLGKYEKAVEEAKKQIELGPDIGFAYTNSASSLIHVGRLGEAENVLQRASERKLEVPGFLIIRFEIAFLRGDQAGMEREVNRAQGTSGAADRVSDQAAFALAYSGHLQQAILKSRHAVDLARQANQPEREAGFEAGPALWEALFGNAPAARQVAMAVLELSTGRDAEYGAAFALALAGDASQAERLATDLETRFPEDTSVKYTFLPAIRALLALKPPLNQKSEPSQAIELLRIAAPYDLGAPRSSVYGFFGALYPIYVRGLAYLAAHQGAEAATEFQKILDHRGIVVTDPIGALAHLQLGRAFAMSGDQTRARTAYQDFLTLWKNADPDIPLLVQAKAEYAKLQSR